METVHSVILSYMALSGNETQSGYGTLREAVRLSWYRLFKNTRESIVRKWVDVKDGVVALPCSAENILGVYVVDDCGDLKPLYRDSIKNILEKPSSKKCGCRECKDEDCLCPTIVPSKVRSTVIIQGTSYENTVSTMVDKETGNIYEEKESWVASYNPNGSFKTAQMIKEKTLKSSVEKSDCGCIKNTGKNLEELGKCGCIDENCSPYARLSYPAIYNQYGYYKIDYSEKKVHIFGSNGRRSELGEVILAFQSNGEDMLVPEYARAALIALLDYTVKLYSPISTGSSIEVAKRNAARTKNEMLQFLHPIPFEVVSTSEAAWRLNNSGGKQRWEKGSCGVRSVDENVLNQTPIVIPQVVNNTTHEVVVMDTYKILKGKVDGLSGSPVNGEYTYQNDMLIGALNVDVLFVNKNVETLIDGDFSFNSTTGEITRTNRWRPNDTFILPITRNSN